MPTTQYQISLDGATYIDANSLYSINTLPDLLPDDLAIQNSLFNIFNCPIGGRGRTFQPSYGSLWFQHKQEPIDAITAGNMWVSMIQAIAKWEPRIALDYSQTVIIPDLTLPGYRVNIVGINTLSKSPVIIQFTEIF